MREKECFGHTWVVIVSLLEHRGFTNDVPTSNGNNIAAFEVLLPIFKSEHEGSEDDEEGLKLHDYYVRYVETNVVVAMEQWFNECGIVRNV